RRVVATSRPGGRRHRGGVRGRGARRQHRGGPAPRPARGRRAGARVSGAARRVRCGIPAGAAGSPAPAAETGGGALGPAAVALGNVCTSDRGAGGRGGGRFTREGATKAELGGAERARAGTRPRGVFRSALACRRPGTTPSATYRVVQRLLSRPRRA